MVSPVRTKRLSPPKDFALRIESFSKLAKASTGANEKYEPIVFSAEGYSWKLQLYPNGNTKGNGRDHISLYLAIVNFPSNQDIYVEFKFFIFDQFNNDYLTIHDGTVKRFHRMKKEWGYDQLLETSVFTDPANGYLVNDSCEFGVEILVVRNYTTESRQTIEMVTPSGIPPFQWTVSNFSTRGDPSYVDPPVSFAEKTWRLKLYPGGKGTAKDNSLSVFLELVGAKEIKPGQQVWAEFKLRVVNQRGLGDKEYTVRHWFSSSRPEEQGVLDFMGLGELAQANKGFVMYNTLILEVEFVDVSVTSNFTT